MSVDKDVRPRAADERSNPSVSREQAHAHRTRTEVDEEIAEMEARSRRQQSTLTAPPEMPPAPPRRALLIVGIAILVLLIAGAITLLDHASHERALAKETEQQTIPTVAVVHPVPEKSDEELVLPG